MQTGDFTQATKNAIAKRANEKCSICNRSTSIPKEGSYSGFTNLGEAAHICGNRLAIYNRYVPAMTDNERSHPYNAIWLCSVCHKEIDSDSIKYTITKLHEYKKIHEKKVSLGEFNNNIFELKAARDKVELLTELLSSKEKNYTLENTLLANEILNIKTQLNFAIKEKDKLEELVNSLENQLSKYAADNNSKDIENIIKEFKEGNLEKLKEILSDEGLELEAKNLASKNSMKATILEIERNYDQADKYYYKAFTIYPSMDNYNQYMHFSRRYKNITLAIKISKEMLETNLDIYSKILVNRALGKTYYDAHSLEKALNCYLEAIHLANNYDISKIELARTNYPIAIIYNEIGDSDKGIYHSLKAISLIEEIEQTEGIKFEDDLYRALLNISLIYLSRQDPKNALKYLEMCEDIILSKEFINKTILISLYTNFLVAAIAINDEFRAAHYLSHLEPLLEEFFSKNPLEYLEGYLSLKLKKGQFFSKIGQIQTAEYEYKKGIEIANEYKNKYNIYYHSQCYYIYTSYAFLFLITDHKKSEHIISEAIEIFETPQKESEIRKNYLSQLYLLKSSFPKDIETKIQLCKKALQYINDCIPSQFNEQLKNNIKGQIRHLNPFDPEL